MFKWYWSPKKGNISFTTDKSNSLFLTRIKETEEGKKFKEKLFDKTKNGFNRIKFDKIIKTEKDFKELCEKNLFESKFLNKIGLKKIDMDNCFEEKQKNYKFFCEYNIGQIILPIGYLSDNLI